VAAGAGAGAGRRADAAGSGQAGFSTGGHAEGAGSGTRCATGCGALAHAAISRAAAHAKTALRAGGRSAVGIAASISEGSCENGVERRAVDVSARRPSTRERAMFWVFLEVVLALAIAVGIVWWTLPRKPKGAREAPPAKDGNPKG
jgi:hypothetical protein